MLQGKLQRDKHQANVYVKLSDRPMRNCDGFSNSLFASNLLLHRRQSRHLPATSNHSAVHDCSNTAKELVWPFSRHSTPSNGNRNTKKLAKSLPIAVLLKS